MPEIPWTKWFPSDWLSDPKVSRCSPDTRGIWMDALAVMMLEQTYFLEGDTDELARLCRCTPEELEAAFAELKAKDVCVITEQSASKRIASRRLQRDYEIKEKRSKAGSKGGKAKAKPKQTSSLTSSSSNISSSLTKIMEGDDAWNLMAENGRTGITREGWIALKRMHPKADHVDVVRECVIALENGGITSSFYGRLKYLLSKSEQDRAGSGSSVTKHQIPAPEYARARLNALSALKRSYRMEIKNGVADAVADCIKGLRDKYRDYPQLVDSCTAEALLREWPDGKNLEDSND